MYFTREPIVETIITPREGSKLVVRNSKGVGQEEYFVDAVEVVNFGSGLFFRSLERPKSFLVPVSDYEIVEVRETRVVLRHAAVGEKPIKIGGGRETVGRAAKEAEPTEKTGRKRERRKGRRRRSKSETPAETEPEEPTQTAEEQGAPPEVESSTSEEIPAAFSAVIPPPKTLISDSIGRYKEMLLPEEDEQEPEQAQPYEEPAREEEPQNSGVFGAFSPGHLLRRFRAKDNEHPGAGPLDED